MQKESVLSHSRVCNVVNSSEAICIDDYPYDAHHRLIDCVKFEFCAPCGSDFDSEDLIEDLIDHDLQDRERIPRNSRHISTEFDACGIAIEMEKAFEYERDACVHVKIFLMLLVIIIFLMHYGTYSYAKQFAIFDMKTELEL